MVDIVSSLMGIMLLVSHMTSSYPSCPEDCHCYQDTGMLTANCTSLPASSENIEILNLTPRRPGHDIQLNEGQFTGFKKLKYLNLSNCSIYNVHKKSFFGVKSLIEIDLSYNKIHSLDSAVFQHITNLTTVTMRGNHFSFDSDDPFLISNTIEHLDIGDCGITRLSPGVFYPMKRLKYILLDKNQLKHLEYNSLPRGLVYINLSNNLIVNVPIDVLVSLKYLRSLDLSGNPINCTCALMNLQDHLSGLGVTFEQDVICGLPPKYAGLSWNQVNENELCIKESLLDERIPIKSHKQVMYEYQPLDTEKNNYFEANFQSDQPYDKQDPNSEILFQNDDTRAMGEMMRHKDEEFDNQEMKTGDFENQESNPEDFEKHYISSKNKMAKKTSFDDVNTESEHKTDSANIVESHTEEIDNPETTTLSVDVEDHGEIDDEFVEQNDGAEITEGSGALSEKSDKVEENKGDNEEAQTEKSVLGYGSENEAKKLAESKSQILNVKDIDDNETTEITPEKVQENILDTEGEQSENRKEAEVNEHTGEQEKNDDFELTTFDPAPLVKNQIGVLDIIDFKGSSQAQNATNNEEIKEPLIESSKMDEIETNIEQLEKVTVQNSVNTEFEYILAGEKIEEKSFDGQLKVENSSEKIDKSETKPDDVIEGTTENVNEDAEIVGSLGINPNGVRTDDKLGQLKVEKGNEEGVTNSNVESIVTEHESETIVGSNNEETKKTKVDETPEAGVKINEEHNLPDSEAVGTTENAEPNIVTGAVKPANEQLLENETEPTNVEATIDKEVVTNLENQPVATTTDSDVPTTLESQSEKVNLDVEIQNLDENTNAPLEIVNTTELSILPVHIEATTYVSAIKVDKNETLHEETNTPAVLENVNDDLTTHYAQNETLHETTISHPEDLVPILIDQDNISDVPQTEQSPTEIIPAINLSPDVMSTENNSVVLGNIKQGDVSEPGGDDDNLIGDKSLKETNPMEFEAAHVVLGCIVVLISVLVLVGIYKCTTEGKKTSRTPKDVESNQGTEMQDMASLLPKPNNEAPKIVNKKYPDEATASETVSLIQEEKKDVPAESKSTRDKENSLNNNTPVQTKPTNQTGTPIVINPSAPIQRTRVKVGIIPDSIPRTPIFVQKSYNNGVTNS